jgi:hypothetical protein
MEKVTKLTNQVDKLNKQNIDSGTFPANCLSPSQISIIFISSELFL